MRALEVELAGRRPVADREPVLQRLAEWLGGHLAGLCGRAIYFPDDKALLSRDGGVCPLDGARLAFDPWAPHTHECPQCGAVHAGDRHHRAWVTRYQIWLSERAVHLALLAGLTRRTAFADCAAEILDGYAGRYRSYPNSDNVLGPTRLFFSTYLESIWLVQITTAAAMLEAVRQEALSPAQWAAVRTMVRESAELVGEFNEGWSNRQVWNNAALTAAGTWLDDPEMVQSAVDGPYGLRRQLTLLGPSGFWPEGENYHLFALRGFLLAAEWCRWGGRSLYHRSRLGAMYTAPLVTLLPDLTLPARGDSPFGVSVRQRRFAELWEVARARTGDRRVDAVLAEIYDPAAAALADDDGLTELAEQEQNRPARCQARDRLGWKALLWMDPAAPQPGVWSAGPVSVLDDLGAVVLRVGSWYAGVETGSTGAAGGGHRHPDALHLSVHREVPVLADFGTGAYVSESLFWYRSTLAHNAPAVADEGQRAGWVWCTAADAGARWAWCRVEGAGILGPDTRAIRTVIVGDDVVVDVVDIEAPDAVAVELPIHPLGIASEKFAVGEGEARFHAGADGSVVLQLAPRRGESWRTRVAPGPPSLHMADGAATPFLVRRAAGRGRWVAVMSPVDRVPERVESRERSVTLVYGAETVCIELHDNGVTVAPAGTETVELRGLRRASPEPVPAQAPAAPVLRVPLTAHPPDITGGWDDVPAITLGARHYRRAELPYDDRFTAAIRLRVHDDAVVFLVDVTKPDLVVRAADAPDPALDNEPADIHSDGVQCYVGWGPAGWQGYLVVPALGPGGARVRAVRGTGADVARVSAASHRRPDGYRLLVRCTTGRTFERGDRFRFSVAINEQRPGRARRSGQLATAGGRWVYLRGDREAASQAWEGAVT